jgi:RNA polymerase sigma-70 factor (ECF subfamily)
MPEEIPVEGEDERVDLLRAVLNLPPKYRAPIHLHYYEGYSIREIAELLGCPAATVGTRLARARRLLHTALTEEEDCHEKV